ncbi:hypothetical protein HID58_005676, partial [Brassica napus]
MGATSSRYMHPKPHRNHRYTLVQWNTLELVHFFHHYKPIKHFTIREKGMVVEDFNMEEAPRLTVRKKKMSFYLFLLSTWITDHL